MAQAVLIADFNKNVSSSVPGGMKNLLFPAKNQTRGALLYDDKTFAPTFEADPVLKFVRGREGKSEIVEANQLNGWLDGQETKAQVRPPYRSNVQIADKIEAPEDSELVNVSNDEIETLEQRDVPINYRLVHIATEDGELMRSEQI